MIRKREFMQRIPVPDIQDLAWAKAHRWSTLNRYRHIYSMRYFNDQKFEEYLMIKNAPEQDENFVDYCLSDESDKFADPEDLLHEGEEDPEEFYASIMHQCPNFNCRGIIKQVFENYECSNQECFVKIFKVLGNPLIEEVIKRIKPSLHEHHKIGCENFLNLCGVEEKIGIWCSNCDFKVLV